MTINKCILHVLFHCVPMLRVGMQAALVDRKEA